MHVLYQYRSKSLCLYIYAYICVGAFVYATKIIMKFRHAFVLLNGNVIKKGQSSARSLLQQHLPDARVFGINFPYNTLRVQST